MRAIRSKDTRPEIQVRRNLHAAGYRFRLHTKNLPGRPDIVLSKHRAAIQVQGCFWHCHDCHLFKVTKTLIEFWLNKVTLIRKQDIRNEVALSSLGWRVLTVWGCVLKAPMRRTDGELTVLTAQWLNTRATQVSLIGPV
jgi:DNA mismatch endonuclease, patch repair protein